VASKETVEELKRRYSRRLLRLPGVNGVGIERAEGPDEYSLVVHVDDDNPQTRTSVQDAVASEAVRIVASGKFRKL
jgi:hypothetical protein